MKTSRSRDIVIKGLLDSIMQGEIKPGDKLPSTENLAKTMGTSTLSAREALKNLESIGLVEIIHGRGMFMTRGLPVIEELLEARKAIESYNAMLAAKSIGKNELKALGELLEEMERAKTAGEADAFSEMDIAFHRLIGKAAGNRILLKTLVNIDGLFRYQQFAMNRLPDIIGNVTSRHREIYEALRKRDGGAASRLMTQHISEVVEYWKRHFTHPAIPNPGKAR
jgi:GntR family transcriptional repressor for pyruvate dehydrogenase complex